MSGEDIAHVVSVGVGREVVVLYIKAWFAVDCLAGSEFPKRMLRLHLCIPRFALVVGFPPEHAMAVCKRIMNLV